MNPPFELDNRNKRSVGLDLATPRAARSPPSSSTEADVFVTNARPGALARAGLDHDTVSARNPRLVYAHVTGYGLDGGGEGPGRLRRRRVLVARRAWPPP